MVEGLIKQRAALAGQMKLAQEDMARISRDLETLDRALAIVAPDLEIAAIAPKMFRPPDDWSRRGEMGRMVLAILRVSQRPLTGREIAQQLIIDRGLASTPKLLNLMTRRVAGCLRDKRDKGIVHNPPQGNGMLLEWEITR